MKWKRLFLYGPGTFFTMMRFWLPDSHPWENKVSLIGIVLLFIGEAIYFKTRTKEEETQDLENERLGKIKLAKAYDAVTNVVPLTEKAIGKKLDDIIQKSKDVKQTPAEQIRELALLKDEGAISEEEFDNAKKKILAG